jgi:hypothetical protein
VNLTIDLDRVISIPTTTAGGSPKLSSFQA